MLTPRWRVPPRTFAALALVWAASVSTTRARIAHADADAHQTDDTTTAQAAPPGSPFHATYDTTRGAVLRSDDGAWTFRPYAMVALRHQTDHSADGVYAENGFRMQATRLVVDARQERWKVQFHYQFHSDEGRLATGIVFARWAPSRRFGLLVGQTRVPFNREHITGFFYHQVIDRSVINARFGLSRDLGVAARAATDDQSFEATLGLWNGARAAAINDNQSYLTTARLVFQPTGPIPYEEGDLAASARPQVALALAFAANPARTFETGPDRKSTTWTNIRQALVEYTLRYRGVSFSTELHARTAQHADGPRRDFGSLLQLGVFVVPHRFELVGRTARIGSSARVVGETRGEHLIGATVYLNGHRFKLQADGAILPRQDSPAERRVRLQTMMMF